MQGQEIKIAERKNPGGDSRAQVQNLINLKYNLFIAAPSADMMTSVEARLV